MSATSLATRLATTGTGFAAVIDGILDVRTISDTANDAAMNALLIKGTMAFATCTDPACDCVVKGLAKLMPSAKIVAVRVEVAHA